MMIVQRSMVEKGRPLTDASRWKYLDGMYSCVAVTSPMSP